MCFRRFYLAGLSILMACLFSIVALADNLVRPDPSIAPAEVVAIQLMSLKNNDLVEADFGIRQTWNFAHPQNPPDKILRVDCFEGGGEQLQHTPLPPCPTAFVRLEGI